MSEKSILKVNSNILTINNCKSDELDYYLKSESFEKNINSSIKNGTINEINTFISNLNILNKFNFQFCNIKKIKYYSYAYNLDEHILFDDLPESLEELDISRIDVKNLNNLPQNLKILKFKCCDLSLENLPNKLESLEIVTGSDLNFEYLPSSLTSLKINFVNTQLNSNLDSLPSSLKNLEIYGSFTGPLNNLPPGLQRLYIPSKYELEIFNLPIGLIELKIGLNYKFLKNIFSNKNAEKYNLKILKIGHPFKSHSTDQSNFDITSIPQTVEHLEFGDEFNQRITWLPPNLKYLLFGFNFRQSIDINYNLPDSIETLIFGYNFNNNIYQYPANLKYLKFGRNYSSCIKNLPNNLEHLVINERFHDKIYLPENLKILEFDESSEFTYNLILPNSIEILILGKYCKSGIDKIPTNLKEITLSQSNKLVKTKLEESGFTGVINYYQKNDQYIDT